MPTTVPEARTDLLFPSQEEVRGLDPSQLRDLSRSEETQRRRVPRPLLAARHLIRIVVPLLVVGAWEGVTASGLVPQQKLDSPSEVISAFSHLIATDQLQQALEVSLRRAGIGLVIGFSIGTSLGLLTGLSRRAEQYLDSSMQMFRMIPFLAIIPLFIIWLGIGETAKVALISFACIFPSYINTYSGVRSIDPKIIEAARVFGLHRLQLARTVIAPNALPGILVGFRYAMGVSILSLIAAEQINASSGLGYLVANAEAAFRNDIIIAIILVYAVLGLLVDLIVRILERVLLPWRAKVV